MKKRVLTLALALSLVMGCMAVPAFAADGQSEEMAKVTLAVKGQLGLGDEYDQFSGDCTDLGVLRYWQLSWSKEDGSSLNVTADSNGKILSYSRYVPDAGDAPVSSWDGNGFNPSFPAVNAAQVEAAARAFLSKVISAPESVQLEPVSLRLSGYRRWVSVSGTVLLNGVHSPMSFSLRLSLPDLAVTSYERRDAWSLVVPGDVPSAQAAVSQSAAQEKLNSALSMELRYVDGEDDAIVLRYVPTTQGSWYVDARTGELVDLSKLPGSGRNGLTTGGSANKNEFMEDAEAPEGSPSLSPAEQGTVDQMAGTLSPDELDALLRKVAPLGLSDMTRAGASYYMGRSVDPKNADKDKEQEITCRLVYTRDLTAAETASDYSSAEADGTPTLRKSVTVDARTGALLRVSTSSRYAKKDAWTGDAAAVVKGFLSAQFPDYFSACVYKEEGKNGGYYVRQVNGIPYYSNSLRSEVCGVDGTIGSFSLEWDEDAKFPAPEHIVDAGTALAAYAGCFETRLGYTAYPEKVDTSDPQWLTYAQQVGDVKFRWVLSYTHSGDTPMGIDALTGEVLTWPGRDTALSYSDLAGCYGRAEIETLAAYGVGFSRGDQFRPTRQVTQRDMLVLLLSALGCTYDADDMDRETEDSLYDTACAQGLLRRDQRDPSKAVTRLDCLKIMLAASAYGQAAQLQGIYHTDFSDAGTIPAGDLGYAAIGQALGIISGDQNRALNPDAPLTRQDAALMLYRFMAR